MNVSSTGQAPSELFRRENTPGGHWVRGCVGPALGLGTFEGREIRLYQPVRSYYKNWANLFCQPKIAFVNGSRVWYE